MAGSKRNLKPKEWDHIIWHEELEDKKVEERAFTVLNNPQAFGEHLYHHRGRCIIRSHMLVVKQSTVGRHICAMRLMHVISNVMICGK